MDITGIAAASTAMHQAATADAVQMTVLKKSLDLQAQGALQLLQAIPSPPAANPPNLGNRVDTFA
jgi:hypothetical protein